MGNNTQKILIITYYWPPSGGAGVQRWLKLSKYLAQQGNEIHILTVNPKKASYFQKDQSLIEEIHPDIKVHFSSSFEPLRIYSKIVGKANVPTAGFSNVDTVNWQSKFINRIRSALFIPDPRIGWKKYAVKKALQIIEKEKITNIITTSPPHSVQLIGLELKKKLKEKINWIVDFRDPWTDIYYYSLLQNSKSSHQKNLDLEREVIESADQIQTVSEGFKSLFLQKTDDIATEKIQVISNGFDTLDFADREKIKQSSDFLISYIGTVADHYDTDVFFRALAQLVEEFPEAPIRFKTTGVISEKLQEFIIEQIGKERTEFSPSVPHQQAVHAMIEAHILLLISPPHPGIVPGKAFEYMASTRRIICIGKGDCGDVIQDCEAGKAFERKEEEAIYHYLKTAYLEFTEKKAFSNNTEKVKQHAWEHKAERIQASIR